MILELLIWIFAAIIVYTYVGYGVLLYPLAKLFGHKSESSLPENLPAVTILIAAYNEEKIIRQKIENTLQLSYPKELLSVILVTDGSTDATASIASSYAGDILHRHNPQRKGKIAALNRIMPEINAEITVFSDANTMLNTEAILNLVKHFQDPLVGVAAGEKRVHTDEGAAASGEGLYWKYESLLKSLDSQLYSVVGAAGELYAIRTELYPEVDPTVIIEDFYIALSIAREGKVTRYAPDAYALEKGSASVKEEMKRKVRIAAGGLQAILLLYPLLNIFNFGWLSFQYISHRVLRWTLAPLGLLVIFIGTMTLALQGNVVYLWIFLAQVAFYLFALIGWILSKRNIRVKALYIPFYFSMMNYAVYAAFFALMGGRKFHIWEKAERAT